MQSDAEEDDGAALAISSEKVCFVALKAREFNVKDVVTIPDPGSNPSDDGEAAVLEDHRDDPDVEVRDQDGSEDHVQQAEQAAGQDHPQREPDIASI